MFWSKKLAAASGDASADAAADINISKDKITFWGILVRVLLSSDEYILVNKPALTKGGPFTRVDQSNKDNTSCLELVIISASLEPFIKELLIDSVGQFSMQSVVTRKVKLVSIPSDQFTLILTLSNLQDTKVCQKVKVWTTMKSDGWTNYEKLTDAKGEEFQKLYSNYLKE